MAIKGCKMKKILQIVARSERPDILVRRFAVQLNEKTPRYWFADNPTATHFMNALSCIFPGGERFFVKSVLAYAKEIKDPTLKADIRAFAGQESVHGQQHNELNEWLERIGLRGKQISAEVEKEMTEQTDKIPPMILLSHTAALEHITAIMGHALLTNPIVLEAINPEVRPLWIWHAIEEIEHKAVAFEVYKAINGSEFHRKLGLIVGTMALLGNAFRLQLKFLAADKQLLNFKAHAGFLYLLFGTGYAQSAARAWADYLRSDFHPWQIDDRELLNSMLGAIAANVGGSSKVSEAVLTEQQAS